MSDGNAPPSRSMITTPKHRAVIMQLFPHIFLALVGGLSVAGFLTSSALF
ncbi:MAG: hypothetical protein ACJAXK_001842 [Yoonia sp.]|jgi:hypothetical protein